MRYREKTSEEPEKTSEEPEKKRMKPSLKQKPLSPLSSFNKTATEDMIEQSSKGIIPKGNAKVTTWTICTFSDWITERNKCNSEIFPSDLFDKPYPIDTMISCLQRFVSEARRVNGTPYPPKTLYQILCSLLRHSREHQSNPPNFLDRKDVQLKKLHGTCDSVFHALRYQGVGADKKSAKIVTKVDEDKLWESGTWFELYFSRQTSGSSIFLCWKDLLLAGRGGAEESQAIAIFQIEDRILIDMYTQSTVRKTGMVGSFNYM